VIPSLLSGGFVALLLKWRPDRDSVIAEGSKSAVEAMKVALDSANASLDDAEQTIGQLRAEITTLRIRLAQLEAEQQATAA
jgi:hypothetical protein